MTEQVLEHTLSFHRFGRQAETDHQEPLESLRRHLRRQVHAKAHPNLYGTLEIGQPLQVFTYLDLAVLLADLLAIRCLRIRTHGKWPRNGITELLDDLGTVVGIGKQNQA